MREYNVLKRGDMDKPLISINLVTFNSSRFIQKCFESISGQTYDKAELLVIDNASSDNSVAQVQKFVAQGDFKFPIRLINSNQNLGFAGGHNWAIRESRGDLILCLNTDMILAPDFLQKAVDFFFQHRNEKVAAIQPKLLRLNEKMEQTGNIDTTGFVIFKNRRIINRGQGAKDEGQLEKIEEVFGADGAAPIYKREALEDIKIRIPVKKKIPSQPLLYQGEGVKEEYFDEDFLAYKEDVDLAWRLRLYGWKTYYVPNVSAGHVRGAGDSAAKNYFGIIRERVKINKFAKYLSFKNQRLMQVKNEQLLILLKHLPWFLPKEIASWIYVILFERFTWKAIRDLFKQAPGAWRKRKIIMTNKKASVGEMEKWFV